MFFTLDFLTVRTNVFSSVQYRSQDVRAAQYANELLRHWIDHGQPPDLPLQHFSPDLGEIRTTRHDVCWFARALQ